MNGNDETNVYPVNLEFDKCPNCGCTETLAARELKKLQDQGRAGEDARAFLYSKRSIVADQRNPMIQVPLVGVEIDMCVDCGTLYATKASVNLSSPHLQAAAPGPNRQRGLLGGN